MILLVSHTSRVITRYINSGLATQFGRRCRSYLQLTLKVMAIVIVVVVNGCSGHS